MIEVMDVCKVVSKKATKDVPFQIGQEVLVVAQEMHQAKRSDPYLFRRYFTVVLVDNDTPQMPNSGLGDDDNGNRAYRMDPKSLEKLSEDRKKEVVKNLA